MFPARVESAVTLQDGVSTAVDGSVLSTVDAAAVLVQISGTFTNITANFEGSLDGETFTAVPLRVPAGTLASTATAVGFYRLEDCRGLTGFRARTTVGSVTGTMTVQAIAVRY